MPLFDAEVSMCVDFAVTASPVLYSSIASLDGYCSWIISGQSTTRGSSTLSRTTRAAPTETIKNPGNNGKGGIQNFTAGQIAGVSIGCASAVILGALACCVGLKKKRGGSQAPLEIDIPDPIYEESKDIKEISIKSPEPIKMDKSRRNHIVDRDLL